MVFTRIDRLGLGQIFNGNKMTKLALDRPIRLGFTVWYLGQGKPGLGAQNLIASP